MKSSDKELLDILKEAYKVSSEKGLINTTYKEFKKQELADVKNGVISLKSKKHALKTFLYEEDDTPFNRATNFSGNLTEKFIDSDYSKIRINKRYERQALIKSLRDNGTNYTYRELLKFNTKELQGLFLDSDIQILRESNYNLKDDFIINESLYQTAVYRGSGKNRQVLAVYIARYDGGDVVAIGRWYLVSGDDIVDETEPYYFNSYYTDQMALSTIISNIGKE